MSDNADRPQRKCAGHGVERYGQPIDQTRKRERLDSSTSSKSQPGGTSISYSAPPTDIGEHQSGSSSDPFANDDITSVASGSKASSAGGKRRRLEAELKAKQKIAALAEQQLQQQKELVQLELELEKATIEEDEEIEEDERLGILTGLSAEETAKIRKVEESIHTTLLDSEKSQEEESLRQQHEKAEDKVAHENDEQANRLAWQATQNYRDAQQRFQEARDAEKAERARRANWTRYTTESQGEAGYTMSGPTGNTLSLGYTGSAGLFGNIGSQGQTGARGNTGSANVNSAPGGGSGVGSGTGGGNPPGNGNGPWGNNHPGSG